MDQPSNHTQKHIVSPLAYDEANNKIHLHMKVIHWWRAALFSHMREQSRAPGLCVPVLPGGVPWPQIRLLIMCHHHQSAATGVRKCLTTTYFFVHSLHNEWIFLQQHALSWLKTCSTFVISDIQVQDFLPANTDSLYFGEKVSFL